ncbi:MAG: ATP phosphoribosyltransferase regulatory subunit, partial [Kiloniellales bacterium]
QVGVELIGAPGERADAEVVLLAVAALVAAGVENLSVDLNLPPLVGAVAEGLGMDRAQEANLRQALDRKDMTAVTAIAGDRAPPFCALLRAAGPADAALAAIERIALPKSAVADLARLRRVVALIGAAAADLTLTVDPVEHRGFEYQTGISFILFARGVRGELGRGGRYVTDFGAEAAAAPESLPESSTGFTLFMDTVERALPSPEPPRRLFLPADCDDEPGQSLRAQGWVTLAGLDPDPKKGSGPKTESDIEAEARRLRCTHAWIDGRIVELTE